MKSRLAILAFVGLALALPASAWGHATLVRTIPANGAIVALAPTEIRVLFDDTVRTGPGIEAIHNSGGSVLDGRPSIAAERTLVIPLRHGLADGDYSARWSIVSDDGHLETGVIAFAIGKGKPASALAAGCPVIVNAHTAHPGTAELTGNAVAAAIVECEMPEGVSA